MLLCNKLFCDKLFWYLQFYFLVGLSPTKKSEKKIINDKTKLLIFVPSISVSELLRNSIHGFQILQNSYLSIIYQLIDPYLHLLYISPIQLSAEEILYLENLLLNLGITIYYKGGKRLHFITPENIKRLPSNIDLSQALYYTSACIRKIKNLIKKYPNVFFIPISFSIKERNICNLFSVPTLSGDLSVSHAISSRSFIKKVCRKFYIVSDFYN